MKYLIALAMLFLLSCQTRHEQKPAPEISAKPDSTAQKMHRDSMAQEEEDAVQKEQYKKYWGYRFHIKGDFDGDGRQEVLTEKLISTRTGQEIAKFCGFEEDDGPDCYWTWRINQFRQPKCLLHCSNPAIADFAKTADSIGTIGLIALQNVGDLNGDRTDEIMYIEDWGGCNSGIRHGNLATYKNGVWKIIIGFETRLGVFPYFEEEWEAVVTPRDLSKPAVKRFERELSKEPPYFKKEKGKILYEEYEVAEPVSKELKINW